MNGIFITEENNIIIKEEIQEKDIIKEKDILFYSPIIFNEFILNFDGIIFQNKINDILLIKNILNNLIKCSCDNIISCFCLINKLFIKLEKYEGEFSISFLYKNQIYFSTDWLGRRCLGYSNIPFSISTFNFKEICNPNYFYKYDLINKKILKIKRNRNLSLKNIPNSLEDSLRFSIKIRLHNFKKVLFFSGGIDSLLLAIILHLELNPLEEIYLINTTFTINSWDRKKGMENYNQLCKIFPLRKFIFIDNFISSPELKIIKLLIKPKNTNMDINIATCLYYSAKKAKEISNIAFIGSGADELFGGYNLYKKDLLKAKENMKNDIYNLWERNTIRDYKIFSHLNIEVRIPFLDKKVIKYAFNQPINNLILLEDKIPIRNLLRNYGFNEAANLVKKAMQFGSGLRDIEKKLIK